MKMAEKKQTKKTILISNYSADHSVLLSHINEYDHTLITCTGACAVAAALGDRSPPKPAD